MIRRSYWLDRGKLFLLLFTSMLGGCALSGSVVDLGSFETKLNAMKLVDYPFLKVCYGGSKREIALKEIATILINPASCATFGGELYYSADITLKDGTRIRSLEKDQSATTRAYISVQNKISGKTDQDYYRIQLDNVARLTVQ